MRKVIFDVETENLNVGMCRPYQIGYRVEENKKVLARKDIWIDIPNLKVSEGAARVTGFTYDEWDRRKEPLVSTLDQIEADFFSDPDTIFVAHNGLGLDIYILRNLFLEGGREIDFKKMILNFRDTLSLSRARYLQLTPPEMGTPEFARFQYQMLAAHERGMKMKLADMCKEMDIPIDISKTHDALYDVDLTSQLDTKLIYALDL